MSAPLAEIELDVLAYRIAVKGEKLEVAAKMVGTTARTVQRRMKRDPYVMRRLKIAMAERDWKFS